MGILITGLTGQQVMITGREMLNIRYKKLFNISTGPGIVEMPGLPKLWKSQGDSHNFLENSESFPQSFGKAKKQLFHIPTMLIFIFKICISVYRKTCISIYRGRCKTTYRKSCIST
jgi:hypothetical protein